jgi:hypothetical protein
MDNLISRLGYRGRYVPSPPSQAIAITVQHFTYNDDDLTLLRSLKYRPFSHIYHDGHYQFVFDFSDNHITACPTDFAAMP